MGSQREPESRCIFFFQLVMDPGTIATLGHHVRSLLTTEEVVDDRVGGTVGVHQPVGEGEASVDGFPVAGLAEHPEHSNTRKEDGEKQIRWAHGRWGVPTAHCCPLGALGLRS